MSTWITICDTCKRPGRDAAQGGKTDGEALAELIEAAAKTHGPALKTRRHSCLMGCARACNVTIQGRGEAGAKISYALGEFSADQDTAEAIVAYARHYDASPSGQVPYRDWPQGVKGHFAARQPPLPDEDP